MVNQQRFGKNVNIKILEIFPRQVTLSFQCIPRLSWAIYIYKYIYNCASNWYPKKVYTQSRASKFFSAQCRPSMGPDL